MRALWQILATLFAIVAVATTAAAEDRKTVLIYVEGDPALFGELAKDVPDGLNSRDGSFILDKKKLKNKFGATLANKKDHGKAIDALADAASASDVAAVVAASSKKPKKGPAVVTIVIVKGGEKSADVETTANDPSARQQVMTKSLASLVPAKPEPTKPEPTKPEPTETKPDETKPDETKPPEPAGDADDLAGFSRATIIAYGGVLGGSRIFEYNQNLTPALRDYQLVAAFNITVGGEVYPLARTKIPFARDLGVEARWSRALGLDSRIPMGPKVDTWWDRFYIGGRGRLRLGKGENPPQLGFSVGYGRWVFAFDDGAYPIAANDPAVRYHQLLFGIDARFPIVKHLAVHGGVSGGPSFVDDPISVRFRHASAGEIAFKAGVAIPIVNHLEAKVTFAYDRFFYAFNSKRGDAYVAGGALDHNLFGILEIGAWFRNACSPSFSFSSRRRHVRARSTNRSSAKAG